MEERELQELIEKYLRSTATPQEEDRLLEWYGSVDWQEVEVMVQDEQEPGQIKIRMLTRLQEHMAGEGRMNIARRRLFYRMAAAAIFIVLLGSAIYWYLPEQHKGGDLEISQQKIAGDFSPGSDKAVLTLGNGQSVILDTIKNGLLSLQGSVTVLKVKAGQLSYVTSNGAASTEVITNTITTPRGGQYMVMLADSTKVWLNAASSLSFPSRFTGKERSVTLTGEGYFEVAHNSGHPFIVRAGKVQVRDIGTAFNINVYGNEPANAVTLVEGLAAVKSGEREVILHPGLAANLVNNKMAVAGADISTATAWKNGVFKFHEADIETVMRQLARWYEMDVQIDGKITQHFNGSIYRNAKASEVFTMFEENGNVRFSIEDKKVWVRPAGKETR